MNLTRFLQRFLKDRLTLEDALPTQMPVYVNSVAYLFGVSTLSAAVLLGATGIIMSLFGPLWYHRQPVGHFFNSLHFWSVQVFFGSVILHGATKFFMAAWRDGRWLTWAAGFVAFLVALAIGLTGYLAQTNWDSQWISVQSKDAVNAVGVGAFFNTMNTSQVLTLHIIVLPIVTLGLIGLHIFLMRSDSPVQPLPMAKRRSDEPAV